MINEANRRGQRLVINMSLGSDGFNQNFHPSLARIIASNSNVLFVISSGNSGHQGRAGLASPAVLAQQYGNVIAVGASWGTRDRDGFARTPGQRIQYNTWGSQYGTGLTLMGPSEVISTEAIRTQSGTQFGYYTSGKHFDGTSAAAPNVAGVASLVWSANRNLSAGQVRGILSRTAVDVGARGYDYAHGHGFVNADAAVRQALAFARTGASSSFASAQGLQGLTNLSTNFNSGSHLNSESSAYGELAQGIVASLNKSFYSSPTLDRDSATKPGEETVLANNSLEELTNQANLGSQLATDTSLKLNDSAELPEAPASKRYDTLTGMNNITNASLNKSSSHLLGSKLGTDSSPIEMAEELSLSYA